MSLVAGSYERFIWGFSLKNPNNSNPGSSKTLTLIPTFSYPSHAAPLRSCAASGSAAASSADDDSVQVYDLSSSSSLGGFPSPSSISSLTFFSSPLTPSVPRNLLAAGDDGCLHIYDADGFVLLKSVRAFRHAAAADAAVHPSGRVALVVSRGEAGLAMVNLVRGRRSFGCRLEKEVEKVKYEGEMGERFVMAVADKVSVHDSEDARLVSELDCGRRVLAVAPAQVQSPWKICRCLVHFCLFGLFE